MTAALDAQGDQGLATAGPAVRGIGARGTRRLGEPNWDTRIAAFGAVAATLKGAAVAGKRRWVGARRGEGGWRGGAWQKGEGTACSFWTALRRQRLKLGGIPSL